MMVAGLLTASLAVAGNVKRAIAQRQLRFQAR